jgi:hypothetical protein
MSVGALLGALIGGYFGVGYAIQIENNSFIGRQIDGVFIPAAGMAVGAITGTILGFGLDLRINGWPAREAFWPSRQMLLPTIAVIAIACVGFLCFLGAAAIRFQGR